MKKSDMREVLDLVKDKLSRSAEAACGLFFQDTNPTSRYAVGEEDATTEYAVGEEDVQVYYGVGD